MRHLQIIRRHPPRLALLIGVALFAAVLTLPAAPGAAAPTRQDQATMTATSTRTTTPTPTSTPVVIVVTATPAATATATPTATPDVPKPDTYEPNNTIGEARPVEFGGKLDKLNFAPDGDIDYFVAFVKPDMVGLTAIVETGITFGLDTRIRLLRPDGSLIAENDDISPGDKRSRIEIVIREAGYVVIEVANTSIVPPEFKTYSLETKLVTAGEAAAQPTPGPEGGKPDAYENNYDFDHAPEIPVGQEIEGLNFLCPVGTPADCGDNDFFSVSLKGGVCYTAQTLKLAPGIDTNLIVYGPERDAARPWAGNDDVAEGMLGSYARFCVPKGMGSVIGYILVGNAGNRIPPPPAAQRTYSLRVDVQTPPTPVSAPAGGGNAAPPAPIAATSAPTAAADAPKGAAIVIAESTALRNAPNARAAVLQELPQETMVTLQGQASGAWVRVQVTNGVLPGWVYGPDLQRLGDAAATAAAAPSPTKAVDAAPVGVGTETTAVSVPAGAASVTSRSAQPTPHITALQPTPAVAPEVAQRLPLAVSVMLVNSTPSGDNRTATPLKVGAGTPTPRASGMRPIVGKRVQLVNAFGDVLAEAVTPDTGEVTFTRDLDPGTAVYLRVPAVGLEVPIDPKQPVLTIAIPVGG
jgi:hypothetical protein